VTDLSVLPSVAAIAIEAEQQKKTPRQGGPGFLEEVDFLDVIRLTRDTWFVPGGRVTKGETLDAAFTRVVRDELGIASMQRSSSRLYGVFEHCYEDNFAGVPGIDTHYVVLAYSITLNGSVPIGRFDQHSGYKWLLPAEVLARDDVHSNAKAYFR
jgi:colanic acid biosynthesis protein WcaH